MTTNDNKWLLIIINYYYSLLLPNTSSIPCGFHILVAFSHEYCNGLGVRAHSREYPLVMTAPPPGETLYPRCPGSMRTSCVPGALSMADRTRPLALRTRRHRGTTGTARVLQWRRVRKSRRVGLLRHLEVPGTPVCGPAREVRGYVNPIETTS